jgi:hypothetical protein
VIQRAPGRLLAPTPSGACVRPHLPSSADAWTQAIETTLATHDPVRQRAMIADAPAADAARWLEALAARLWPQPGLAADADPLPREFALGHAGIDAEAAGETRPLPHRRIPFGLREIGVEGGEQPGRTVIGGAVAGIASIAMLEHLDVRHAADACELRDLGRDVADHQRRIGLGEPVRHACHRLPDSGPAERRAMQGVRRRHPVGVRRLDPGRLEQRRDADDLRLRRQVRKDVVARTEDRQRPFGGERVRDRRAALGMAATLMMNEITERPHHAAIRGAAMAGASARPSRSSPSSTPAA